MNIINKIAESLAKKEQITNEDVLLLLKDFRDVYQRNLDLSAALQSAVKDLKTMKEVIEQLRLPSESENKNE